MQYAEFLLKLKAMPPSDRAAKLLLREFFKATGIGDAEWDALFQGITAASLQLDTGAGIQVAPGQLAWNADEETADLGLNGAVLQLGLEMLYHVQNDTGVAIPDGQAVMFAESVGASGRGRVVPMDGSNPENAKLFIGLATEELPDGDTGKITHFGRVRGINASGADAVKPKLCFAPEVWEDGDTIYVDPVNPGFLTTAEPAVPLMNLPIGFVISNHANTGTIFVRSTSHDQQHAWGDRVGGDYVALQENGTIELHGAAGMIVDSVSGKGIKIDTVTPDYGWHDLTGEITIRGVAATDPSFQPYIGTMIRQYQFTVGDFVHNTFHVEHDQAPATDLYIHAHWSHNSLAVVGGSVTWEFEVAYAKGHDQAPFIVKTFEVTQNASTIQHQHMIAEIVFTNAGGTGGLLDNTLIEADGLFLVSTRLKASSLTGGVLPFLHYADMHYQSTGLPTKNKAPNFY